VSDYLNAPKIHNIDALSYRGAVGDRITVKATDDFMVKAVKVTFTDKTSAVIEEGEAGPDVDKVNLWAYVASVANTSLPGTIIRAVALDRPGNSESAQVVL
jgi:hypothetical protein